ncbi:hypothetical protein ACIQZO_25940 [Streptomyces sp. NPDC097617]|uniref:hypothetical protein n=1 Tax=Streptomyces sp. NPDC097617 TaxID=3366091 RepID=UPI00380C325F
MIEFDDPQLPEQDLVLLPDEALRGDEHPGAGQNPDAPPPLRGRVRLGGPLAQRLTHDQLAGDPDLADYVTAQAGMYEYYLVRLSLTFAPTPQRPRLEFAHLALDLSAKPETPPPVAHSMDPMRLTDAVQVTQTRRLGPQLSLLGADASLGEVGRSQEFTTHQPFAQALGLHESTPGWEFRRTVATELTGCHVLRLVIRTAAGSVTDLGCTVTAGVKIPLLRRYTRALPRPLRLEAAL